MLGELLKPSAEGALKSDESQNVAKAIRSLEGIGAQEGRGGGPRVFAGEA